MLTQVDSQVLVFLSLSLSMPPLNLNCKYPLGTVAVDFDDVPTQTATKLFWANIATQWSWWRTVLTPQHLFFFPLKN